MTRKKRVLLLTQWFEPEPTFKGLVFARELVARGYEVEVVTGFPNYPGGKVYPGYRVKWRQRELVEGITVTRLALYPSHDSSAFRRVANYSSFAATALVYCLFQARRADVIYVYQLLTLGVTAAIVKLVRGTPFVFDIMDLWPDTLRATGMVGSDRVLDAVQRAAKWVYRHADRVVVLSPGFQARLLRIGVPAAKVKLIYNWADEAALRSTQGATVGGFPKDGKFRILFAGNMGKAQALGAVLDAAALVAEAQPNVLFVFMGSGVEAESLKAAATSRRLGNVVFLPRVEIAQVGAFLKSADALLVHLKADPLFEITIPGKTQAYMAIGKPVLMAAPGDAAQLIAQADCGVIAKPEDAAAIAGAAVRLATTEPDELREMGERGRRYYDTHLALGVGAGTFTEVFEEVTTGQRALGSLKRA